MQKIRRKGVTEVLRQHVDGELEYLTFPKLDDTGLVEHIVATRYGGVSEGIYGTMNLSFGRGDAKENVEKNYQIVARVIHSDTKDIVCTHQTHTTNVRRVSMEDKGKGIVIPRDYSDVDALITNAKNVVLSAFFADCVPILFLDPVKKAIGSAHSGWRGTVGRIGREVVKSMQEAFDSEAKDIIACIGPSICQSCYEVSEDVAAQFAQEFGKDRASLILYRKDNGKYQLDLWMANYLVLTDAGVLPENISVTDICTCCNPQYLFSHRASHGERGGLGAFIKLIG